MLFQEHMLKFSACYEFSNTPGLMAEGKAACMKSGFEHHSGLQVSKKQNVSAPLTRKKNNIVGEPL